jgi:hypothetical protein
MRPVVTDGPDLSSAVSTVAVLLEAARLTTCIPAVTNVFHGTSVRTDAGTQLAHNQTSSTRKANVSV